MKTAFFAALPLFASLPAEVLETLAEHSSTRTFDKGETILREGARAEGMYIVLEGVAKVIRLTPEGREMVLHLIRKGNTLGEAAVFQRGTFPAGAEAVGKVCALYLPADVLLRLVTENPELALRMLASLSLRLRMFAHKLAAQGQGGAARRLAAYLLHRSQLEHSLVVHLGVSREVLANLLGIARETLSRQLSRFAECGALSFQGREVRILNEELLREFAELSCFNPQPVPSAD